MPAVCYISTKYHTSSVHLMASQSPHSIVVFKKCAPRYDPNLKLSVARALSALLVYSQ